MFPCYNVLTLEHKQQQYLKHVFKTDDVAFGCFFSGKLLKAEYILSSLISNNGATGKVLSYLHHNLHTLSLPEFQLRSNLRASQLLYVGYSQNSLELALPLMKEVASVKQFTYLCFHFLLLKMKTKQPHLLLLPCGVACGT